jgi:uncharacterized protein involved in outer membrane biogenesis
VYDLNKITAEIKIEDMDVNALFSEFENFGQTAVESKHLQGNIFVDAKFKTDLDDKMEVIGNTMNGEIKLKLKDGHLLNFEPLQNISDYVYRNRNFKEQNSLPLPIKPDDISKIIMRYIYGCNYNCPYFRPTPPSCPPVWVYMKKKDWYNI